ncbi:hypothetical protein D3C73_1449580 [compost metagenome]
MESLFSLIRLKSSAKSVAIVLGVNADTRILLRRTSWARDSVNPITANLDALYALEVAAPFSPLVEDILMISPPFLAIN